MCSSLNALLEKILSLIAAKVHILYETYCIIFIFSFYLPYSIWLFFLFVFLYLPFYEKSEQNYILPFYLLLNE